MDGHGFTPSTWAEAATFGGRCATPHDVDGGAAVYALTETWNARPLAMDLPQPVIWWDEDDEQGALAVQAETHETDDGETMDVLGLLLADGRVAVALLENVDLVDASDPVWRAMVEAELADAEAWDDDDALATWDGDEDDDEGTDARLP